MIVTTLSTQGPPPLECTTLSGAVLPFDSAPPVRAALRAVWQSLTGNRRDDAQAGNAGCLHPRQRSRGLRYTGRVPVASACQNHWRKIYRSDLSGHTGNPPSRWLWLSACHRCHHILQLRPLVTVLPVATGILTYKYDYWPSLWSFYCN